jgi:hypothetical protein
MRALYLVRSAKNALSIMAFVALLMSGYQALAAPVPPPPSKPDLATASDNGDDSFDNNTYDDTPTFDGTAVSLADVTLTSNIDGTLGTTTANSIGTWSFTAAALTIGDHNITATQVDADGNISGSSIPLVMTIVAPATVPSTPVLDGASDSGVSSIDNITNIDTPTFTGTASPLSTIEIFSGIISLNTVTTNSVGVWSGISLVALAPATHQITATAYDANGSVLNSAAALTLIVDTSALATSPPNLAAASDNGLSDSDNITNDVTPTIDGTAEAGAAVTVSDGGIILSTVTADPSGVWSLTTTTMTDGDHVITATQTDVAGNSSVASATLTITIDSAAPAAPGAPDLDTASDSGTSVYNGVGGDLAALVTDDITKITTPTFSGTGEVGSLIALTSSVDGALGTATADSGGAWSVTASTLTEGVHDITAISTDVAGGISGQSTALSITIDVTPPAQPVISGLFHAAATLTSTTNRSDALIDGTVVAGTNNRLRVISDIDTLIVSLVNSAWTAAPSSGFGAGVHNITATAVDPAGNESSDAVAAFTFDYIAPSVTLSAAAVSPTNGVFSATATFSEAVTGFDTTGLAIVNGTASNFVAVSASVYTFDVTPTADGAVMVDVASAAATDAAGNDSTAGNLTTAAAQISVTVDGTAPSVVLSTTATSPHADAFTVTATFSEAVTGFDLTAISVGNGAASAFAATSTSVYTFTVMPTADGAVTVDVARGFAHDAAGYPNTAATQISVTAYVTMPRVLLTTTADSRHNTTSTPTTNAALFPITAAFDEAVTGFDVTDVVVSNGTVSGFVAASPSVYTFNVTPTQDGDVNINVATNSAIDAAGTPNRAATQLRIISDRTPIMAWVTSYGRSGPISVNVADTPLIVEIQFSEPVLIGGLPDSRALTGFDATDSNDLMFHGGLTSAVSTPLDERGGKASRFQALINFDHPYDQHGATGSITVAAPNLVDNAGNLMGNGYHFVWVVDNIPPDPPATAPETNYSASATASATLRMRSFPTTTAFDFYLFQGIQRRASVPHAAVPDGAGAVSTATSDAVGAPVFLGRATVGADGYATLVLSTPLPDGTHEIRARAIDAAGNESLPGPALIITIDTTAPDGAAPSVELSTNATSPHIGAFPVTATFVDDVTGFDVTDIGVGNGTAGNFVAVSPTEYTFDVTPAADGAVTVDIAAGAAQDSAGNPSTAASQISVSIDASAPSVVLTGPNGVVSAAFTVTATFSETVTGLLQSEIDVTNGVVTGFAGTDAMYTLTIEPTMGTTVVVLIPANVATDSAGRQNTVSNTLSFQAASPASEFEDQRQAVTEIVVDLAQSALQNMMTTNRRLISSARTRFIRNRRGAEGCSDPCVEPPASRNDVAFDIDGTAQISNGTFSSQGTFFEQTGYGGDGPRRLFFGDFNVERSVDGTVSAQAAGRIAWERMISENTMFGYFIGAEIGRASVDNAFVGHQDALGLSLGGYVVSELHNNLFANGYLSFGIGRNSLQLSNATLDLASSYSTRTFSLGFALTGVIEREGYEIWPELAFDYGLTHIGHIGLTGTAYGVIDNTLTLNAGRVSIASMTFAPEFRVPMDGLSVADSNALLTFAPRLVCEYVQALTAPNNCGGGAEFGVVTSSDDGLTQLEAKITVDRLSGRTRTGFLVNFERQF